MRTKFLRAVGAPIIAVLLGMATCAGAATSLADGSPPATMPATQPAQPDLSTPRKAAVAYYRAILDRDGGLLTACVDTRDDGVRRIIAAKAAAFNASRHYAKAVKSKFGEDATDVLPAGANPDLLRLIVQSIPNAVVEIRKDSASLTPSLAHNPGEGDFGPMFQMELSKIDGAWKIRLQGSSDLFRRQVTGGSRAAAEITAAQAVEMEAVATQIDQGQIKDAKEASQLLQARNETAQAKIIRHWQDEKKARAATQAASQPK